MRRPAPRPGTAVVGRATGTGHRPGRPWRGPARRELPPPPHAPRRRPVRLLLLRPQDGRRPLGREAPGPGDRPARRGRGRRPPGGRRRRPDPQGPRGLRGLRREDADRGRRRRRELPRPRPGRAAVRRRRSGTARPAHDPVHGQRRHDRRRRRPPRTVRSRTRPAGRVDRPVHAARRAAPRRVPGVRIPWWVATAGSARGSPGRRVARGGGGGTPCRAGPDRRPVTCWRRSASGPARRPA